MARFAGFAIGTVLVLSLAVLGVNEWNLTHGFAQLISSAWSFLGIVLGTGLMVPTVAMLCDVLKQRKEIGAKATLDKADRDNQATLEVERIRQRVEQSHKDGFDGKAG